MKTQLNELLSREYHLLLWRIKCRLALNVGSQKKAAELLGVDPTYLSKVLSGVTDCNSRLFFSILQLVGMVIIVNDLHLKDV